MTFILISGKTNVGKTLVCNELHSMIAADATFVVHGRQQRQTANDFIAHYEKGGKHIVLNSPSDNDNCMTEFCQYLDGLPQKERPDIIITTIRETNLHHDQMSRMLALLDAFAKGTAGMATQYTSGIMTKPIHTLFAPAALDCHAFVLHLEKQQMNVSGEELEQALVPYWNNNADTAKQMLDLAVARL